MKVTVQFEMIYEQLESGIERTTVRVVMNHVMNTSARLTYGVECVRTQCAALTGRVFRGAAFLVGVSSDCAGTVMYGRGGVR